MKDDKIFEDFTWAQADCNECARYWDSSCDGVTKDSRKPCNSFLATRNVVIPQQIKALESSLKWLIVGSIFTDIALIIHILSHLFGR